MSSMQRLLAWFGGILLGIILVIVVVGLIRGDLAPGAALGLLSPAFAGVTTLLVVKAKSDNDKMGEPQ